MKIAQGGSWGFGGGGEKLEGGDKAKKNNNTRLRRERKEKIWKKKKRKEICSVCVCYFIFNVRLPHPYPFIYVFFISRCVCVCVCVLMGLFFKEDIMPSHPPATHLSYSHLVDKEKSKEDRFEKRNLKFFLSPSRHSLFFFPLLPSKLVFSPHPKKSSWTSLCYLHHIA